MIDLYMRSYNIYCIIINLICGRQIINRISYNEWGCVNNTIASNRMPRHGINRPWSGNLSHNFLVSAFKTQTYFTLELYEHFRHQFPVCLSTSLKETRRRTAEGGRRELVLFEWESRGHVTHGERESAVQQGEETVQAHSDGRTTNRS